jgi:aryl-alcohol dehydrogenase-like predicted oxidoreductase
MQQRQLGNTGIAVSELGLGCQSLGGGLYHGGRRAALDLVAAAADSGITFFDTSDHYTLGRSEEYLGAALRGRRQQVVIATKVGTTYSRVARAALTLRPAVRLFAGALRPFKLALHQARASRRNCDFSANYIRAACEASLRRLGTDYVDLLQLHKPPAALLANDELRRALETLRRDGKVRALGVAVDTHEEALLVLRNSDFRVLQLTINLLDQQPVATVLPLAQAGGVGIIARNPRAQGHLTDALSDIAAETYARNEGEVRQRTQQARAYMFLTESGRTLAQAALRFVLQLSGVSTVAPRMFNREHLPEILRTLEAPPLTAVELRRIGEVAVAAGTLAPRHRYRSTSL